MRLTSWNLPTSCILVMCIVVIAVMSSAHGLVRSRRGHPHPRRQSIQHSYNLTLQQNLVSSGEGICGKSWSFFDKVQEMGICMTELLAVIDVFPHTPEAAVKFSQSNKECMNAIKNDMERARSLSRKLCRAVKQPWPTIRIEFIDYANASVVSILGRTFKEFLDCEYDEFNIDKPVLCMFPESNTNVSGTIFEVMNAMWRRSKNHITYMHTLALVRTRHLLHVDDDVRIITHTNKWLSRALDALGEDDSIVAVNFAGDFRPVPDTKASDCEHTHKDWPFGDVTPFKDDLVTMDWCGGGPHLSMQAFLMDMTRMMHLLPLVGPGPLGNKHIESIFAMGFRNKHAIPVFLDTKYGCKMHGKSSLPSLSQFTPLSCPEDCSIAPG